VKVSLYLDEDSQDNVSCFIKCYHV